MVDTCYKKHGFPPHFNKGNTVNKYIVEEEVLDDDDESNSIAQEDENDNPNMLSFTLERHRGLLTLLQKNSFSHNANHITTT